MRWLVSLLWVVTLGASPALAEVTVDTHLHLETDMPGGEGLGPDITASVVAHNGWGVQLAWSYAHLTSRGEDEDGEPRLWDTSTQHLLVGATRRAVVDTSSFASIGFGIATSYGRNRQVPSDWAWAFPDRAVRVGAWLDGRVAVEVLQLGNGSSLTAGASVQIVVTNAVSGAVSGGIGFRWR